MLRDNKIIKAIYKTMAKLTGKDSPKEDNTNKAESTNSEKSNTLSTSEQKNAILNFLKEKNEGMWTSEADIEKALASKIHYYYVRQLLPYLRSEGHLDYTTMQESYKLSIHGKEFLAKGGYTY
jgi:hypothetical protein